MFGSIFSGVTLIVTTGNGLPNFTTGSEMSLPCPGLAGITLPSSATPGYQKLLLPHPAFEPDCGNTPHATPARPLFPMDCAAEVAILAYFAQPSVGGANAKATNEAALSASDNNVPTLYSLSNASVKWLSKNTDDLVLFGPQPDPTAPLSTYPEGPIGIPLVSRMMGGLQFTLPAAVLPPQPGHAITGSQAVGCPTWTQSPCGDLIPEQALFNALRVFFGGTSKASAFDAPATIMNNEAPVTDAPMNFLQIWADDIQYAAGAGACTIAEIMKETCVRVSQNKMPAIFIRFFGGDHGRTATAQDILVFASKNIPTTPVTNADLYWYNKCKNKNQIPYCEKGSYYHRDAFEEDLPCVSASQQNAAIQETNNGLSKNPKLNNYSTNTTDYSVHPYYYQPVPYGRCAANYVWRQSYMGDYVCVTQQDQAQILDQNAGIVSGVGITCP